MSWTYAAVFDATTSNGQRNIVRLLSQENNSARQRVADEEIDYFLSAEANPYMAAARVAEMCAARVGPVTSKRVGSLSVSYGAGFYTELAARLRARGASYQVPSAGGFRKSEKLASVADADIIVEEVTLHMHDHPETTGQQTSPSLRIIP